MDGGRGGGGLMMIEIRVKVKAAQDEFIYFFIPRLFLEMSFPEP